MKAWSQDSLGQPPRLTDLAMPTPAPGEFWCKSLRRASTRRSSEAEGRYQDRPALPFVPGLELAGTVVSAPRARFPRHRHTGRAAHVAGGPSPDTARSGGPLLPCPTTCPSPSPQAFPSPTHSHLALTHAARLAPAKNPVRHRRRGRCRPDRGRDRGRLGARVIAQVRGADKAALVRQAGASEVIDQH